MRLPMIALALATLTTAAAAAQTPPAATPSPAPAPAPAPVPPAMAQPVNIVPETMRYAQCLAAQRPVETDAYLATVPGSPGELLAANALVPVGDTACASAAPAAAGGVAAIPVMFFRGGLAEARYLTKYAGAAPAVVTGAAPVGMAEEMMRARVAGAADPQLEVTRVFGDCVVAAWAGGVDQLVRAEAGSAAEMAAITALQPAMGSCLYQNQTIPFTRETLRAPLADALYRKSEGMAAVVPPTAPADQPGEPRR